MVVDDENGVEDFLLMASAFGGRSVGLTQFPMADSLSPPLNTHLQPRTIKKQCSNNVKIRYKCIKHIGLLIKIRVLDEQSCPRKIFSYNFNALGQIY